MCCALNVFVLTLDVLFKLAVVRTIAVERNDKGKKTEEGEEQQETFFYGIDKLWKENAHDQITTPFGVV